MREQVLRSVSCSLYICKSQFEMGTADSPIYMHTLRERNSFDNQIKIVSTFYHTSYVTIEPPVCPQSAPSISLSLHLCLPCDKKCAYQMLPLSSSPFCPIQAATLLRL